MSNNKNTGLGDGGADLTPKQKYEARKAERKAWQNLEYQKRQITETLAIMDFVDRFVTAHEQLVEAVSEIARSRNSENR